MDPAKPLTPAADQEEESASDTEFVIDLPGEPVLGNVDTPPVGTPNTGDESMEEEDDDDVDGPSRFCGFTEAEAVEAATARPILLDPEDATFEADMTDLEAVPCCVTTEVPKVTSPAKGKVKAIKPAAIIPTSSVAVASPLSPTASSPAIKPVPKKVATPAPQAFQRRESREWRPSGVLFKPLKIGEIL